MTAVRHDMGLAFSTRGLRLSRVRVPWTRGATSGALLVLLGAWAAIVPFIGPYMKFAYTPSAGTAWHWTAARGWFEVAPGAVALVGGLMLLLSTYRPVTLAGSWLAIAAGMWLIVGPPIARVLNQNIGTPDPTSSTNVQALEQLFFFYGIGALILLVSAVALGRLSVQSLRDVTAAEKVAVAETRAAEDEQWTTGLREPRPVGEGMPQQTMARQGATPPPTMPPPTMPPPTMPPPAMAPPTMPPATMAPSTPVYGGPAYRAAHRPPEDAVENETATLPTAPDRPVGTTE